MVSKPCCHPESTLFVRTKDPGAPRNHSRIRCENANQRVWRASLTPPTTSCSNTTDASCACRLSAPSTRRKLGPAALNHITRRNCHPERGAFSFAERGTERAVRMPRVCCAAISRTLGAHSNRRETGEPLSGERMQPTAQAVGRVQRRRKAQRGERN